VTRPRDGRAGPHPRPLCLLVHAYYEEDSRVRRQAETLVRAGRPVDVFALRRPGEPAEGVIDGVRLRRLDVQRHQGAGVGTYVAEYLDFFVRAMAAATVAHRRRRYAVLQAASLPDFLVFAGLPLRLAGGVPLILDLHEAMPEFFRSRFPSRASRLADAALRAQERWSIGIATAVITVNDMLGDRLVALGVPRAKVTVIMNAADLARFDPAALPVRPFMADGTLRLIYAGALTPIYELDVALQAVAILARDRPEIPVGLRILGRGDSAADLAAEAERLGIGARIELPGRVPLEDVPGWIAQADVGLAPTRRTEFTDVSLSTKIFEYAAMGKPVVASALPAVEHYFDAATLARYRPGDADGLAAALAGLVDDPALREARVAATSARLRVLGWDVQGAAYVQLVERVAADGLSSRRSSPDRVAPPEAS
jgi:glycosyltransferase involved in cell wall biosynthesis